MSIHETETGKRPDLINTKKQEILASGIETERLESIPIDSLIFEESIIDEEHCDKLAESMRGKRGQISPITVRARFDENSHIVYDIIDGFHRAAALHKIQDVDKQNKDVKAVVVYGCSDEELYDLRVLAVNSVRSVSFPRMITWMQRSFEQTEWYKKGMTLSQVMAIAINNSVRSYSGLDSQGVEDVKVWASDKASRWNKPITAIYQDTRSVENADPNLVRRVRIGAGGKHGKKGILNPARFRAMVDELPGQYELQNVMADIISRYNLDQHKTRVVAREVARCRDNQEALDLIKADPLSAIGEFTSEIEMEEPEFPAIIKHRTHHGRTRQDPLPHTNLDGYLLPNGKAATNESQIENKSPSLINLTEQQTDNSLWFDSIPDLTAKELDIAQLYFAQGKDVDDISLEMDILPNKVYSLLRSITRKYIIMKEHIRIRSLVATVKKSTEKK